MEIKKITKENFTKFVTGLITSSGVEVVGVQEKENGKFHYAPLKNAGNLRLDYDVTLTPPKKFLTPPVETIARFKMKPGIAVEGVVEVTPRVLVGVHPYDLKAINQMDHIFADKNNDENYLERRKQTAIISVDPKAVSKKSFWGGMDASNTDLGFDLHLTDIGDSYTVAVGTPKGTELLKKFATVTDATAEDIEKRQQIKDDLPKLCNRKPAVNTTDIRKLLRANYDSHAWEKRADKCYSCGSCNLVCPTCYCFDVLESVDISLNSGERTRRWDGCLLEDFAAVGTGENFREEKADRIRHRIFRKGVYMDEKYGFLACVGCGRCSSVCLPDIADPVDILNELKEGK